MKSFITNNIIKEFLKNGQVNEAMQSPIKQSPRNTRDKLRQRFRPDSSSVEDNLISGLILGDFIYDFLRINPTVIKGVDFSRSEDLDSVFSFSAFARNIESLPKSNYLGNISQMQGYVAEQVAAWQLQSQGYEVSFPKTSNQAGYDLLVDGKQFQVKCVADPQHIVEHFEKYPDIPVVANIELADQLHNMDNVYYMPELVHADIVNQTTDTLHHAAELQDFEVPWITAMVSSGMNLRLLYRQETDWIHALTNVGGDVASRTIGGWVGQHGISVIGGVFFGPAGTVVGGLGGAVLGSRWARNVTKALKSTLTSRERQVVEESCVQLLKKSQLLVDHKLAAKDEKKIIIFDSIDTTKSETNRSVGQWITKHFDEDVSYYKQKQKQLGYYANDFRKIPGENTQEQASRTLELFLQMSIHPAEVQNELGEVFSALEKLTNELKSYRLHTDNRFDKIGKEMTQIQSKQDDLCDQQIENTEMLIDKLDEIQKSHEDSLKTMEEYISIYEMQIEDMNKHLQEFCLDSIDRDRVRIDEFFQDINSKQFKNQEELVERFRNIEKRINKFACEIEEKLIKEKDSILQSLNILDENKVKKLIREYQSQYNQAPAIAIDLLANGSCLYEVYNLKQKNIGLSLEDLIIIKYGKAVEKIMFDTARKKGFSDPKNETSMGKLRYLLRFTSCVDGAIREVINLRNKSAHPDVITEGDISLMRTLLFEDRLIEKLFDTSSYLR